MRGQCLVREEFVDEAIVVGVLLDVVVSGIGQHLDLSVSAPRFGQSFGVRARNDGVAIRGQDYFVIQGVVLMLIVSLAVLLFLVDLIYPLLDPRIRL